MTNYGHGTHIAGIIGGTGKYSTCSNCSVVIGGIAPNVNIIHLRALDDRGQGTDSSVIKAIQAGHSAQVAVTNIRVLNLSLGRGVYESYSQDPLCQAVEQAWKAGIVVVVAAGNDGRDRTYNGYATVNATRQRSLRHHCWLDEYQGNTVPSVTM
jgi:serine protease AprX